MGSSSFRSLAAGVAVAVACQLAAIASAAAPGTATAAAQLLRTKTRPGGAIVLTVAVREAGQLTAVGLWGPGSRRAGAARVGGSGVVGAARPLPKPFGSALVNPRGPATIRLKLHPTPAARAVLRSRHRLRVYITVTLLPTHGSSVTLRTHATARLRPRPGR